MGLTALAFPGQGSQSVGMCRDLYEAHDIVRRTYDEANQVLGYDLAALSFEGPLERLSRTDVTQPALLTASVAVFRLVRERGLRFDCAFGHSLGEYSALVATGALRFSAAVALVRRRGEAMQAAAGRPAGGMLAILGLDDDLVEQLCGEVADVWPANFNCPGQVVVSGTEKGLEAIGSRASETGARKTVRLPVSGAFHSPFMRSAADTLADALVDVAWGQPEPRFFSVNTVAFEDGRGGAPTDVVSFADLLMGQVTAPVRFTQSVGSLMDAGYDRFVEVGPGAVLTGLMRRIAPDAALARVGDEETLAALGE